MSVGGFSLDQLMELAGLSVSQAGWLSRQETSENHGRVGTTKNLLSRGVARALAFYVVIGGRVPSGAPRLI